MNARAFALAAALVLAAAGAHAATTDTPPAAAFTNHWLYDVNGDAIGSVRKITNDGQTAELIIGEYFRPGVHAVSVPVSALAVRDGRVTLEPSSVQALNLPPRH